MIWSAFLADQTTKIPSSVLPTPYNIKCSSLSTAEIPNAVNQLESIKVTEKDSIPPEVDVMRLKIRGLENPIIDMDAISCSVDDRWPVENHPG